MDGRNLSKSIILKWTPQNALIDIINTIPIFIKKVLTSKVYEFYGEFTLNSVYNLKNYNNMLVNSFPCNFLLIISDDCLVLFKQLEQDAEVNCYGKIVFWALLFSITDIQINKDKKIVRINFYDNDEDKVILRLRLGNILYFKETLIKKMSNLKIKNESNKLIKGHYIENKITMRDINNMDINEIEQFIGNLGLNFLLQMKEVLKRDNVQKILNKNKNIDKEINSENNENIL